MAVVRCSHGHFYDDSRYTVCPHCGIGTGTDYMSSGMEDSRRKRGGLFSFMKRSSDDDRTVAMTAADDDRTVAMASSDDDKTVAMTADENDHTIAMNDFDRDDEVTIGVYSAAKGNDPVVGWLVCVQGPERGRDYRLCHGMNRLGRNAEMEIRVMDDTAITRENQCSFAYDDKKNRFLAVPGQDGVTFLNEEMLTGPRELKTGDRISAGNSVFVFIPFCEGDRTWEAMQE